LIMPTGYTAAVSDGTTTELHEFAMQCARAFGALITMRDDPASTEIPDEFVADDYYKKALDDARSELAALEAMATETIRAEAAKANDKALKSHRDYLTAKAQIRARYEVMIGKVQGWTPPTADHQELKDFMLRQLHESIRFDCNYVPEESKARTPTEWLNGRREALKRDVARYTEEHAKECDRAAKRTAWVKALRGSLKESVR
jgi:hypothetical protein